MSQKQQLLHELLQEDQEPFHLKKYISDKRCQLEKPNSSILQVKKRNPISSTFQDSKFNCKNPCFFALTKSPTKSPLPKFDLRSPSNKNTPNAVFLHVSPKTASLLLEAAVRVQKQSKNKKTNFGLIGSLLKKLSSRKKSPASGCSQEKCLDLELESFLVNNNNNNDKQFGESPFHFVLLRSPPSPGRRTPDFTSPATSPIRPKDKADTNLECSLKSQVQAEAEEEKEEEDEDEEEEVEKQDKEQFSPVSVLDPPFEDDDDGCDQNVEDDGFDLDSSYAIVQRVKKQLLQRLNRFEKLARLDPVELEKRMSDQELDRDASSLEEEANGGEDEELDSLNEKKNIDMFIIEEVSRTSFNKLVKMPKDMKRLVSDLIGEEEKDQSLFANGEVMVKRVCNKFESWKDVETNTIDMMVEQDFKREGEEWKRFPEQMEEAKFQIELEVFGLLMEELMDELLVLTGIL